MRRRRLGRTGLLASEIGVGCWAIGGPFVNLGLGAGWDGITDGDAKKGLTTAIELGANLFDTADVYGLGTSERLLGWMLGRIRKDGIVKREDMVIVSKVGYFRGCAPHGFDTLHMKHQLEMSLQNLNTDYLDIYFFHHLDFGPDDMYLQPAVEQMQEFKTKGLVRFIGLRGPHQFSLYRGTKQAGFVGSYDRFLQLAEVVNPDVVSVRYNMITPTYDKPESDIFGWAERADIGILTYKPLGQGLLLDKYDPANPPVFSSGDHRSRKVWFRENGLEVLRSRLAQIRSRFGCRTTQDLVQLAIKYCLSRSKSACVVVGFRNASQVRQSLSTEGYLTQDECSYIKKVFDGVRDEIGEFIDSDGDA
jgi:aryl-alcohol dehydrogenase-like predicted oxidoreductase